MKHMLDTVNDRGPVRALGNIDDAFEAQEPRTAMLGQRFQEQCQSNGVERLIANDSISLNLRVMPRIPVYVGACGLAEPSLDRKRAGTRIKGHTLQKSRIDAAVMRSHERCRRIELCKPVEQDMLTAVRQIGFGQYKAIGQRHLLYGNRFAGQCACAIHRVHCRHHTVQNEAAGSMDHERLENRGRIRKPAGLDDDAGKRRDSALIAPA